MERWSCTAPTRGPIVVDLVEHDLVKGLNLQGYRRPHSYSESLGSYLTVDILATIFGEDFLRYVLAQDDLYLNGANLSSSQTAVLRALMGLALQMQAQPAAARNIGLVNAILTYADDKKTSLANTWRSKCGGDLITPSNIGDPVLSSLLILARDVYPAFILPRQDDLPTSDMAISGPIFRHPEWRPFCRAVLADKDLQTLFPAQSKAQSEIDEAMLETSSVLTYSSGRVGTLQLALLPDILLSAAYLRYLLPGNARTQQGFASSVKQVVDEARRLAAKQTVDVPLIYGITNIEFPPAARVEVSFGTLRGYDRTDRQFIPEAVDVGAVLETTGAIRILDINAFHADEAQRAPMQAQKHNKEMSRWTQYADRKCDLMRLAILLSSSPENFLVAHQGSRTILDPLQRIPAMRWTAIGRGASRVASMSITPLGEETLRHVKHWAQKVSHHPENLDIAMRRTLSSVAERIDPLDGFIDAVLAWENLFSGRPETNLRVCGAIAWFLEPGSYNRRLQLFDELSKLYTTRSGLVHGSMATIDNAVAARDRAVQISIACMRRLHETPDLLHAKDSSVRGRMLLMGSSVDPTEAY
jgi:hypothetical protein